MAEILGGRFDGHVVEYHGKSVEFKGEPYVALVTNHGEIYYLLKSMQNEWFKAPR